MSNAKITGETPGPQTPHPGAEPRPPKLIMVAVDDSDQSTWAAQVAASFARLFSAEVVLVHVMDPNALGASELAFTEAEWRADLRSRVDRIFKAAASHFARGISTQQLLREGNPGREIIASADEWGADLLVMGTHGRGRLATFLLGSTAEAVIQSVHCPVLMVAHDPLQPPRPAAASGVGLMSIAL